MNSPDWLDLTHAYGSAGDIPILLSQLDKSKSRRSSPTEEPWYSLWSALAHQGDVYSASYAAAQHFVDDLYCCTLEAQLDRIIIVAWIEQCRLNGCGPEVPENLQPSYETALSHARTHLMDFLKAKPSLEFKQDADNILSAVAALCGWNELANHLSDRDLDEDSA